MYPSHTFNLEFRYLGRVRWLNITINHCSQCCILHIWPSWGLNYSVAVHHSQRQMSTIVWCHCQEKSPLPHIIELYNICKRCSTRTIYSCMRCTTLLTCGKKLTATVDVASNFKVIEDIGSPWWLFLSSTYKHKIKYFHTSTSSSSSQNPCFLSDYCYLIKLDIFLVFQGQGSHLHVLPWPQ